MKKNEFEQLVLEEILPHMQAVQKIIARNGVEGILVCALNARGYIDVTHGKEPYSLTKFCDNIYTVSENGKSSEYKPLPAVDENADIFVPIALARRDELILLEQRMDMLTEYLQECCVERVFARDVARYLGIALKEGAEK